MKYRTILSIVLILFCHTAYAAEIKPSGSAVHVERKASDIRVVMYMTSW